MPDNLVILKQDEYERMMKAVRFVEGMQRGPVRGHEPPEQPPAPPAGTVYVKVTGPEDTDFRPGDAETKYYPCVLTEKVIPTPEEETEYGPISQSDYWKDYDAAEDEEGRVFAWNGATLTEGNRYSVDPIDVKGKEGEDGQYTIFVLNDPGGGTSSDPCTTDTFVTGVTFDEETCTIDVTTVEVNYRDCT